MIFRSSIRECQFRLWSNDRLRQVEKEFGEYRSVLNVSGWADSDKEGGQYRDYFSRCDSYAVSNHPDDKAKGISSPSDISLDLNDELPESLIDSYDIVLNHTVLEHLRYPEPAFAKIAQISSDIVITIVPWKQVLHFVPSQFGDYYRFSPLVMRDYYISNGLTLLREDFMPAFAPDTYLFYVGSKHPNRHPKLAKNAIEPAERLNGRVGKSSGLDTAKGMGIRLISLLYRKIGVKV